MKPLSPELAARLHLQHDAPRPHPLYHLFLLKLSHDGVTKTVLVTGKNRDQAMRSLPREQRVNAIVECQQIMNDVKPFPFFREV